MGEFGYPSSSISSSLFCGRVWIPFLIYFIIYFRRLDIVLVVDESEPEPEVWLRKINCSLFLLILTEPVVSQVTVESLDTHIRDRREERKRTKEKERETERPPNKRFFKKNKKDTPAKKKSWPNKMKKNALLSGHRAGVPGNLPYCQGSNLWKSSRRSVPGSGVSVGVDRGQPLTDPNPGTIPLICHDPGIMKIFTHSRLSLGHDSFE